MVNGLIYDFESIKLMLPTGLILGCESVEYSDEKADEVICGTNNLPLGVGRGEWKGTCKLELQRFEYDKLNIFAVYSDIFLQKHINRIKIGRLCFRCQDLIRQIEIEYIIAHKTAARP